MYTQDKVNRITLRLNDEQFRYLKMSADLLSVSPSEFLRMVINATMAMHTDAESLARAQELGHVVTIREEEERRENETSGKHNKL